MCNIRDFAPLALFERIDRDANGAITSYELNNFLRDHHVYTISESEAFNLVKFFDSDNDNRLSFQDFLQLLLPCEDNLLRSITLDRPHYSRVSRFDSLPCDIESAAVEILQQEVDLARRCDGLRRELEVRFDYSALSAYRSVDKYNDGNINTCNLGAFLRATGHYASERELLAIIRRIDTDGDARLSYAETAEFLRSSGPSASMSASASVSRARSAERGRRSMAASNSSPMRASSPSRVYHSPVRRCTYYYPYCSPVRESPIRCPSPRRSPVRVSYSPSRKPLLHLQDEDQLISGLKEVVNVERELETAKTTLAMKSDFNMYDTFRIFDQNNNGWISAFELRDGFNAMGVYPTHDELELFITRYDKNGDRRLTFSELSEAFLALDAYYASMVNRRHSNDHRRPFYRREDCFYPATVADFRNLCRVHFRTENQSEAVRQRLQRNPYFNVYEAFNSLDLNDSGSISKDEFRRMIESRGFYVSQKEVDQLVDKIDQNKDGRVSFAEFSKELRPKSP